MKDYPLAKVFQLLEPGPTLLVSTAQRGRANLMTMSWHMMMEFEPPLLACVVSNANHSFTALSKTGECVLALPHVGLAKQVVDVGNCSGRDVDKFASLGLTPVPAALVKPPLVGECFANLECRVADTALVDTYNLFVLEVVRAWRTPALMGPDLRPPKTIHHNGDGTFRVAGRTLNLRARMVKWPEFV
ncbi:MAG: flavin reductase [Deltaproteobacteria bacterium HGW-Deltaproteobacteria-8]|jgi:flavin reductase (DIM6/NTAB) family NADH-FMN oxidoreductase RutF|nr:MAG: flavin reductase [Deltaproteobacteria bacterium HGW-Deltaproteobacteria-8]